MSNTKNNKLFYLGLGSIDAKTNVSNLTELANQVNELGAFYQDNDIVWVTAEKAFYTINKSTTPPYELYETGGSGGSGGTENVTVYYGFQDEILSFLNGVTSNKPSNLGFSHGDGIIASRTVSAQQKTITKFDVYEADTQSDPEKYLFIGSMKGEDGIDGLQGPQGTPGTPGAQGEKGDPFVVDEQGLRADRDVDCASKVVGYSFLATDEGLLYFKESEPCNWSAGIPFGKGDPGATTYTVFKGALKENQPATPTANSTVEDVINNQGWFDAPPSLTGTSDRLWMSRASYTVNDTFITWSDPVILDGEPGEEGGDGVDGTNGGFWTIWSDSQAPDFTLTDFPELQVGGEYTLTLTNTDWTDNTGVSPIWMATSTLNMNTLVWGAWQTSKIAGEKPPYLLDLYKRATSAPANVLTTVPYYTGGEISTGADAAILVNGDPANSGNTGWTDTPPAGSDPLYFIELIIKYDATNNNWSPPLSTDGAEGKSAGYWVIWSSAPIETPPTLPEPADNLITYNQPPAEDSIDLSAYPQWGDDVGDVTGEITFQATTYYKNNSWTPWARVQVKGKDGLDAEDSKIFTEFNVGVSATTGGGKWYPTLRSATEDAALEDATGGYNSIESLWHDGEDPLSEPVVGNRLYNDAAGNSPLLHDPVAYLAITEESGGENLAVGFIQVNKTGYVQAYYSRDDATAMIPALILGSMVLRKDSGYLGQRGGARFNGILYTPKFATVNLICTSAVTIGSRLYQVGEVVSVPFQHESENNDLRSVQVGWKEFLSTSYDIYWACSTIKVFGLSASSGQNGYQISEANWSLEMTVYY